MSTTTDTTGATPPTETESSAPARRTRNQRQRDRRAAASRRNDQRSAPEVSKFKGTVKEMNGHVFQCHGETKVQNQYTRTLEELDSYVGLHFKYSPGDIKKMIKSMTDTEQTLPADPRDKASKTEKRIWEKEVDSYCKRKDTYISNKIALYSVIWSQCSEVMQARLKSSKDFESMNDDSDSLALLLEIKGISYRFEAQSNLYLALTHAKAAIYAYQQGPNETNASFMSKFKNYIEVIEHYGGTIGDDVALINEELKNLQSSGDTDTDLEMAKQMARNKAHAIFFMTKADKGRYGQLVIDLENQYTRGTDQYPATITETYNMLVNYKKPANNRERNATRRTNRGTAATTENTNSGRGDEEEQHDDVAFVQHAETAQPPAIENVKCFKCNEYGHYSNSCPNPPTNEGRSNPAIQLLQLENDDIEDGYDGTEDNNFTFNLTTEDVTISKKHSMIDQDWILLDSESTVNIFSNRKFLRNIRQSDKERGLRVHSNGGHQDTHLVGDLPGFGTVWYNKHSLANILSLAAVRKRYKVTMNTDEEAAMVVHKKNGEQMKFLESSGGLYYYNAKTKAQVKNYSFINSVADNKAIYTRRQLERAELARRVYELVGRPSHAMFIKMIREQHLPNCPVTVDDANRAVKIYGTDVAALQGKTTRRTPEHVPSNQLYPLPLSLLDAHKQVTICFDIFFVDGITFFATVSRNIHFITVECITSRSIKTHVIPAIKKVLNLYHARGFTIITAHADEEFQSLRDPLLALANIHLNIAATNEHVPEIERAIRTIKERNRATVSALPFKHYPKLIKREIIKKNVTWLNMLPHNDGISPTMSPRTIVTGMIANYDIHCRVPIGAYCEVHNENNPSNTETPRTSGAIALTPTGNLQGGYWFLSLVTGKRISRRRWTELPITDDAIQRVHELALIEKDPQPANQHFQFSWGPNLPILDVNDDIEEPPADPPAFEGAFQNDENEEEEEEEEDTPSDDESIGDNEDTPSDDESIEEDEEENPDEDETIVDEEHDEVIIEVEGAQGATATGNDEAEVEGAQGATAAGTANERRKVHWEEVIEEDETNNEEEIPPPPHKYNLRGNKIDHSFRFNQQQSSFTQKAEYVPLGPNHDPLTDIQNHIMAVGMVFNQMGVKAGVKAFGDKAVDAVVQECKQLDDKRAFKPRAIAHLTEMERKRALRSITLVTRKRCGRIKGRTVADGRGQRDYIPRDDATSPTVSVEALMISLAIDAKEGRAVATADVEGAYLHADMDETVIMMFEGQMVDYMVQANPEKYGPYVHTTKKGKKILYVELLKALYGCIKSALLWYKLFTSTLEQMGFVLNPYDPCVANKMINGKQCTICWYVDDLKVSHMEKDVVNDIIATIEKKYGKMTVTHGAKHTYVGMDIEFKGDGEVKILMIDYLKESIEAFPEDCTTANKVNTPAASHLFEVNEDCPKLNETDRKILHHIVAKLLFVAKRARPDIQVPIAFLTSRVTKADEDDWKKLKRLLQYLQSTIDMPLTLSIDNMSIIKTWVDASYAIHNDMRSHTGGTIMMGKGALYAKSSKQKLNVKSSTEAEFVGASDFLPQAIWTRNFVEAQGYEIDEHEFHQDNMSAQRMQKNGRASAGQKSRHINIRYFFIKDRIDNGEISVVHCPTEDMIADFFTKPLQGSLFVKFRDIIMGITHFSTLDPPTQMKPRSVLE